jgi:hypothetical protein
MLPGAITATTGGMIFSPIDAEFVRTYPPRLGKTGRFGFAALPI